MLFPGFGLLSLGKRGQESWKTEPGILGIPKGSVFFEPIPESCPWNSLLIVPMKSHGNENILDFWDLWMRWKQFLGISRSVCPPGMGILWGFIPSLFPRKLFQPGMGQFPMEAPPGAQIRLDSSMGWNSLEADMESHQSHLEFQRDGGEKFHGTQNPGREEELLLLPRIPFPFGIPWESRQEDVGTERGEIPTLPGILGISQAA